MQGTESKSRAAARARAKAATAPTDVDITAEGATTWGRDVVDDVAGDGAVDGDAMSARYQAPAAP